MNVHDEAKDLQIDWALGEHLAAETPPDLCGAVLERLRREPSAADGRMDAGASNARRRWLAAAIVLLGIGAVLGAALWTPHAKNTGKAPADEPALQGPEPKPAQVYSLDDVSKLPADTRAVEMQSVGDEVLEALAARAGKGELPHLDSLSAINSGHQTYGLGLKVMLPPGEKSITAVGLHSIAAFAKLRRLTLGGTFALRSNPPADGPPLLTPLLRLPMLQELTIRFVDTTDADLALLPQLCALQKLDLSFNHGFAAGGIDAIVKCGQLTSLSLRGCQQLQGSLLAKLGALPQLEHLDLGVIDGINWRNVPGEPNDSEIAIVKRAKGRAGLGVTDEALIGIARAGKLRRLDIANGHFGDAGIAALGVLPQLEVLDLGGAHLRDGFPADLPEGLRELHVCGEFTDVFCTSLGEHLGKLRHLDVAACYQITDAGVASLIALPELRVLELRQCRGLTPACIDVLGKARQIEDLDLRHIEWVTADRVQKLRTGMASLRVLETSLEQQPGAEVLPAAVVVRSRAEIESLPEGVRNVQGIDLTDDAMPAFARLQHLERLEISAQWTLPGAQQGGRRPVQDYRSITDAGLRQLATLPALRILQLRGQHQIHGPGLTVIVQLPALRECQVHKMVLDDASLAPLTQHPELRAISLDFCEGFGERTLKGLAHLPRLQQLSLRYCSHLDEVAIAQLGASRSLEQLNLAWIGSHATYHAWANGPARLAVESGSGVSDAAMAGLATLVRLRVLNLSHAGITGASLRGLSGMPMLDTIDLSGCLGLGDTDLPGIVAIPSLRNLNLANCPQFTAAAVTSLLDGKQLEELDLRGWKLDEDQRARLRQLPKLTRLELAEPSTPARR